MHNLAWYSLNILFDFQDGQKESGFWEFRNVVKHPSASLKNSPTLYASPQIVTVALQEQVRYFCSFTLSCEPEVNSREMERVTSCSVLRASLVVTGVFTR